MTTQKFVTILVIVLVIFVYFVSTSMLLIHKSSNSIIFFFDHKFLNNLIFAIMAAKGDVLNVHCVWPCSNTYDNKSCYNVCIWENNGVAFCYSRLPSLSSEKDCCCNLWSKQREIFCQQEVLLLLHQWCPYHKKTNLSKIIKLRAYQIFDDEENSSV